MFDVFIIAAGDGQRLKEEGILTPKPLIEINGVPLILRLINVAVQNGASSISCIINEQSDKLKQFLGSCKIDIPFNLIVKSTPSSLHSFYELKKYLSSERFLLTTTDSIFLEDEFKSFVNFCINHKKAEGILAVTDFIDDEKPLYVELDNETKIRRFSDTSNNCNYVTGGLYFFHRSVLNNLETSINASTNRLRNYLKLLAIESHKLYAFKFSKIIDVDHAADINKAEEFLQSSI